MSSEPPILFYDGDCGLCARSVQWALRHDRRGVVKFAPLQGATFARLVSANRPDLDTALFRDESGVHRRSEAVLRLLSQLGGPWPLVAAVGGVFPRALRDWCYRYVAARRLRWYGTAESCGLPNEKDAERFLD